MQCDLILTNYTCKGKVTFQVDMNFREGGHTSIRCSDQ